MVLEPARTRRDLRDDGCRVLDFLHGQAAQVRKKIAKLHTSSAPP
jgi:hypothetical protein